MKCNTIIVGTLLSAASVLPTAIAGRKKEVKGWSGSKGSKKGSKSSKSGHKQDALCDAFEGVDPIDAFEHAKKVSAAYSDLVFEWMNDDTNAQAVYDDGVTTGELHKDLFFPDDSRRRLSSSGSSSGSTEESGSTKSSGSGSHSSSSDGDDVDKILCAFTVSLIKEHKGYCFADEWFDALASVAILWMEGFAEGLDYEGFDARHCLEGYFDYHIPMPWEDTA